MINASASRLLVLAAALATLLPAPADGQVRRGRAAAEGPGWAPIAPGVRVGYDDNSNGPVLAAHVHVPVLPNGLVDVTPHAEVTFLDGARDYQYAVDLVYVTGARAGGLYVGGSVGFRDSVIEASEESPRDNYLTYGLVAGFRTDSRSAIQPELTLRWIFLREATSAFRPRPISVGVSFPLWGRVEGG